MKLSYLITCHNETDTLQNLFNRLLANLGDDELVVLRDSTNPMSEGTRKVFSTLLNDNRISSYEHPLDNNYGGHKDWGAGKCSGNYIFQIDGDELPSEYIIGENLHTIIESNEAVELFFVPRINDFRGVTPQHAAQWGWRLTPSPKCENRPIVNWPDWQGRIFKNEPSRIKWDRRLHEKLIGHTSYSYLPAEEDFALYHDKTIQKQVETNIRYNKLFTQEENKGHGVV